jgi:hypothetical protein
MEREINEHRVFKDSILLVQGLFGSLSLLIHHSYQKTPLIDGENIREKINSKPNS